ISSAQDVTDVFDDGASLFANVQVRDTHLVDFNSAKSVVRIPTTCARNKDQVVDCFDVRKTTSGGRLPLNHLCFRHDYSYEVCTVAEPSRPMCTEAVETPVNGSAIVAAPARMIDPAGRAKSNLRASRQIASYARIGLPRIAAVDPTAETAPSSSNVTPRFAIVVAVSVESNSSHEPSTYLLAEVLSAITSWSENLKFSYRESMISSAGATAETASIKGTSCCAVKSRSRATRNATSGSILG